MDRQVRLNSVVRSQELLVSPPICSQLAVIVEAINPKFNAHSALRSSFDAFGRCRLFSIKQTAPIRYTPSFRAMPLSKDNMKNKI